MRTKLVFALHAHVFKNGVQSRLDWTTFWKTYSDTLSSLIKTGGGCETHVLACHAHVWKNRIQDCLDWTTFENIYSDTLSSLIKTGGGYETHVLALHRTFSKNGCGTVWTRLPFWNIYSGTLSSLIQNWWWIRNKMSRMFTMMQPSVTWTFIMMQSELARWWCLNLHVDSAQRVKHGLSNTNLYFRRHW